MNPCLKIEIAQLKKDPALQPNARGTRKLIVTELYKDKEIEAESDIWSAPKIGQKCPVLYMKDTEMAVFNQTTIQDKHFHKVGTEIYMVIEGEFFINIKEKSYHLLIGDMIVIQPGAVHEVINKDNKYLCRVITLQCKGVGDKYVV